MSNDRIDRLEERMMWLERHIAEQDKVILQQGDQLKKFQEELLRLRVRAEGDGGPAIGPANEKPPHY